MRRLLRSYWDIACVAVILAGLGAFALADNFLRDDGTFQPITGSTQSITNGNGLTLTPSPCVGSCTIGITAPVSTANGGTGVVSPSAHTIPVNEGSSAQGNTGTGTTGQCLASQGANADPAYKSGCRVLLATLTASASATIDDQTACASANCITSTYNDYELVFENILPANNNTTCEIRVHSQSGGAGFKAATYLSTAVFGSTSGVSASAANFTTFIPCSQTTNVANSGAGVSGHIRIYNPSASSNPVQWEGRFVNINSTMQVNGVGGAWNTNAAIDGFQVLFSAGNITSGSVKIYGLL
jgi:hypothetical protein